MFYNNESIGGRGGYGGYGDCGFGGGGILGMIALLSLFRGHFGEGRHEEAGKCLCQIEAQLGSIQGQIGEAQYNTVTNLMQSTSTLLQSICNGNYQNLQALTAVSNQLQGELFGISKEICAVDKDVLNTKFELSKEILIGNNITNQNILKQGFENQLGNEKQTNYLSRQISDCCCETNNNITVQGYETRIRDIMNQNENNVKFAELACGQKEIMGEINKSRLLDENARLKEKVETLREKDERCFMAGLAAKTDCLVNNLGQSAFAYTNITTPTTPFNWKNPSCCGCW